MPQVEVESSIKQLVGLFLAEILRSRKTSIRRAAEISRRVLVLLSQVSSEKEVLRLLSEVEKDFEEIVILKQALNFDYSPSDIKVYEYEIKQYASSLFLYDMSASASFLQDAAKTEATIQELCIKYPDFCQYLLTSTDKKELMKAFVA